MLGPILFSRDWFTRSDVPLVCRLVLVVFQTKFKLLYRPIRCLDGFDAVAAEIMRGMFHVYFRPTKGLERFADFRTVPPEPPRAWRAARSPQVLRERWPCSAPPAPW
jgi:hypothetical protein